MSHDVALFDANVLYPAPLRDILLQLAVTDIFHGKWTKDIQQEWIEALLKNEPHRQRSSLERTRDLMNQATRDCLITGYELLIPSLTLPDENDRHVLAAAIVGHCNIIVTQNLKDFPETILNPLGIVAQHPDDFLCNYLDLFPTIFCEAVRKVRLRLKNPPFTVNQYLNTLIRQGLVQTVSNLRPFVKIL